MFFFCFSNTIYALPTDPVTETVGVYASVAEVIVVTPGGGNTSGGVAIPKTAVSFSGQAYPYALVTLLKQGEDVATVTANSAGDFNITLEENYNSNALYSLFAVDVNNERSLLLNYPIVVRVGLLTQLSGIRFAPTVVADKSQVRAGDYLMISGYALPRRNLSVTVKGMSNKVFSLISSDKGPYKIVLPLANLPKGDYSVFVNYTGDARTSKLIRFSIGDSNIFYTGVLSGIPGDCNSDKVINLVDFSVLAFWYGKSNPPACVDTNKDKIINLVDFSILAFYWTG
ncbi:MAG TPA: hypothetical protein VGO63_02270 [Candidatus Paceibacterota bacterium]|nr:hypothetical protein [Candidatus Paceibacterota bacterium]